MHEDMQVSSKKPVPGAFYSRGSHLVKFPWQSSNFWNSPQKRGQSCTPILPVHNSEIFGNSESSMRVTAKFFACDRKIFANFPKTFARITKKSLPE